MKFIMHRNDNDRRKIEILQSRIGSSLTLTLCAVVDEGFLNGNQELLNALDGNDAVEVEVSIAKVLAAIPCKGGES